VVCCSAGCCWCCRRCTAWATPVLGNAVAGRYALAFLLILALSKILATSLTIGIGGSGGVFAPSLFIGAMLGAAFGTLTHHLLPHLTGPPGAYALVGMGAVFAGAARTPITAVMILFELTGEYTIILPLMVAIALSAGLSRLISPDTIYTRKLRRCGIHLDRPARARTLDRLTVATAMRPLPQPLHPATTLPELATRFATTTDTALPVIDDNGELRGTVLAAETDTATAADLARTVPALRPDQSLEDALAEPIRHGPGLPVADPTSGHVTAWLTHREILHTAAGHTVPPARGCRFRLGSSRPRGTGMTPILQPRAARTVSFAGGAMTDARPRLAGGEAWWERVARVERDTAAARATYDRLAGVYDLVEGAVRTPRPCCGCWPATPASGVLEVGPGTGHGLVTLAGQVGPAGTAIGVDLSARMGARARRRLARAGYTASSAVVRGDARQLPIGHATVDAVMMSFVLDLIDTDQIPTVLVECRSVLRPTGRLVIVALDLMEPPPTMTRLTCRGTATCPGCWTAGRSRSPTCCD